jgi:UDP-GlcNAc3NAcA epimerase
MRIKIVSIVGARPQFIKLGALSRQLRLHFDEIVIHTGQHYDHEMSEVFFERLSLPKPDYHLGVGSGLHGAQTAEMLKAIEKILVEQKPDRVVIFGDTNSTLAGGLAAVKLRIPVAHVEAGLRSYTQMPEEINRRIVDHISDLLFAPTAAAVVNMQRESVPGKILEVGDLLVEAVAHVQAEFDARSYLTTLGLSPRDYWLVTLHRADLTDSPTTLQAVLRRLSSLDGPSVFPLHPRTREALRRYGLEAQIPSHVKVIDPVGFGEMLALQSLARGIVTDSGGVQREAYILGTPCFTVRNETEWPETLQGGWNQVVGEDACDLQQALKADAPSGDRNPVFGDGTTASQICASIAAHHR